MLMDINNVTETYTVYKETMKYEIFILNIQVDQRFFRCSATLCFRYLGNSCQITAAFARNLVRKVSVLFKRLFMRSHLAGTGYKLR